MNGHELDIVAVCHVSVCVVVSGNTVAGTCPVFSQCRFKVSVEFVEAGHECISVGLECVSIVRVCLLQFIKDKGNLSLVCNRVEPAVWVVLECFFITVFVVVVSFITVVIMTAVVIVTFVRITSHEDVHVHASRNGESVFALCFNVDCSVANTFFSLKENVHVMDKFDKFCFR